jgi:hypothetical protein
MNTTSECVVTLGVDTNKTLKHLAVLKGVDEMSLLNVLVERAVKDAAYRHKRNAQAWAEKKALQENVEVLKAAARAKGIDLAALGLE